MEQILHSLQTLLASNQFFQGGIVLAACSWLFYQLKAWPVMAYQKIKYFTTYSAYFDDSDEFYDAFALWFADRCPDKFRNVEVRFRLSSERSTNVPAAPKPQGPKWQVRKLQFTDSNTLFYKGRWLWVRKKREKVESAGVQQLFINSYTVSGFFARKALSALCEEVLQSKIASEKSTSLRVMTPRAGGWEFATRYVDVVKTFDHVFFSQKQQLVADLEKFVLQKEFYRERGINYKRAYLFYGPPGTGKTTLGTAIAKYLDYSLCALNLASLSNTTLQEMGSKIEPKTVILLEDIDCVLDERSVKGEGEKGPVLNFSTLLNFLDGLFAPSDCIFVLTTNHPEKLDAALTRKGRVDLSLHVDYPTAADVTAFVDDFYGRPASTWWVGIGRAKVGMAEIQDICLRNEYADAVAQIQRLFEATEKVARPLVTSKRANARETTTVAGR